jgi:hypothetical protein
VEWSFLECLLVVGIRFGVWCVVVAAVVAVVAAGVCARTPSSGSECATQFTTQCTAQFREIQSREYQQFTKLRTSNVLRKMGHLAGWCAPAPQGTERHTNRKEEREREREREGMWPAAAASGRRLRHAAGCCFPTPRPT